MHRPIVNPTLIPRKNAKKTIRTNENNPALIPSSKIIATDGAYSFINPGPRESREALGPNIYDDNDDVDSDDDEDCEDEEDDEDDDDDVDSDDDEDCEDDDHDEDDDDDVIDSGDDEDCEDEDEEEEDDDDERA